MPPHKFYSFPLLVRSLIIKYLSVAKSDSRVFVLKAGKILLVSYGYESTSQIHCSNP